MSGLGRDQKRCMTHPLAEFVAGLNYETIPQEVIRFTKTCLLDLFGSAFAAIGTPLSIAAGKFSETAFGKGQVTRWDTGKKTSVAGATWINSALASAIDIDDGHRLAIGHPGAAIIPAAVGLGEYVSASGKRLQEAIVAGYEVAIHISASRNPLQIENVATGGWGGFGAAMAASKLLSHSVPMIQNTLGLTAMYGPRLPGYFPGGRRMVKEGIPWSAVAGVSSALLAHAGFTGPEDVFESLPLYDAEQTLEGLGKDFLILKTYFKRYPCCRWLHPVIEGCLALMAEGDFQTSHIQSVRVQTFSRAFSLPNRSHPQTLEEAQFSIPFCSALAMTQKEAGFYHIRPPDLDNPEVLRLAEKIILEHSPRFDEVFPERILSRVTIETQKGKFGKECSTPKGDPDHPFSEEELEDKYVQYAQPVLGRRRAHRLRDLILNLEEVSIIDLMPLLGPRREGQK
jgi:2-methylcitrate dehydratase PrpD